MTRKLLEGVKICDFTRVIVGPLTTKTLSDYGAEVIKIEGNKNLDIFRIQATNPDSSAAFNQWNTGKMSVTLNLNDPKGKEIALKIAAWADIVIENYAGGVISKLGLGYEDIKKVNPDVIMLSSCMQGQTGPFAHHPGWGFQLSALSGFSNITGWPDRPPPDIGVYTDFITPQYNVCLLIGALLYRKRTGKGMYIDTAQFETGLHFIAPLLLDYFVNGRAANRMGNRSDTAAPHNAYRCKDEPRYCVIHISSDDDWGKLWRAAGHPEWSKDERFATSEKRSIKINELRNLVESWTTGLNVEDVMNVMSPAGLPVSRLMDGNGYQSMENAYRCKDEERWCAIAVTTGDEWLNFCQVIGNPGWTKDGRFSTLEGRKQNEDELDRLVEQWAKEYNAFDVMYRMQNAGVPAGVVENGEDQLEHDLQTRHRQLFQEVVHPRLGTLHSVSSPFKLSKVFCEVKTSPLLGEHNEYVLKEILGYSDEEVVEFVVNGVLG